MREISQKALSITASVAAFLFLIERAAAQVSLSNQVIHQVVGGDDHARGLALGDVNGDGHLDVAVSDPQFNLMTRAWILLGPDFAMNLELQIPGLAPWDLFPGIGDPFFLEDLNGDSLDDLLMASRFSRAGGEITGVGRVLIAFAPNFDGWVELQHPLPGQAIEFGASAIVHDLTGDGIKDIAVGSPRAPGDGGAPSVGRIDVFDGTLLDHPSVLTIQPSPGEQFLDSWGWILHAADWDQDGASELMINDRPDGEFLGPGQTWVDLESIDAQLSWQFNSIDLFWWNDLVEDVDGDGFVDFLASNGDDLVGLAFGPDFAEQLFFPEPSSDSNTQWGDGLAVGDINRDGHQDLLVGSPELDDAQGGTAVGNVRVFFGPNFQAVQDLVGEHPFAQFGISVRTADLNGDGFDEVLVGAGAEQGGRVHLFQHLTHRIVGSNQISVFDGGSIQYSIEVGELGADQIYVLALSASGAIPGVTLTSPVGPIHLPLNPDALTIASISQANQLVFERFIGVTDSEGMAEPRLNLSPLDNSALIGISLTSVGVMLENAGAVVYSTNAEEVLLIP